MNIRIGAVLSAALLVAAGHAAMAQTKPATAPAPAASGAPAAPKATPPDKPKAGKDGGPDTSEAPKPSAAGASAATPAKPAQPDQAGGGRPGAGSVATGWAVNCATAQPAGKLRCEVSNNVVITPANQRFVSVAVRRDLNTSEELMVLTLPHGVLFTSGITAQVDGKDAGKFEPLTSDQQGAYAKMPMTAETTAALAKGETLNVIFDGANGQKFTVGMALSGFGAAHAKMKAEN